MAETKTKIAQELSPDELVEFCQALRDVPHGEMATRIMGLAKERGISIGRSAAYEFKNKEVMPFLRRLRMRVEKAEQLKQAASGESNDSAQTLADFTAGELSQIAFDAVSEFDGKLDLSTPEGLATFDILTKSVKRLRDGDRALFKQLVKVVEETKEDLQNPQLSEAERAARMRARFGV